MWKQFRHFLGRAWLAGLFTWFPAGLLGDTVGIGTFAYAQWNLTPYSVSVRGYHRSDGTYVRAHRRRPPGSVEHDEPYEFLRIFSVLLFLAGTTVAGIPIYRIAQKSDWDLLPKLVYESNLPDKPREICVPHKSAKARSAWLCARCRTLISPCDSYYYYGDRWRTRFCPQCRIQLLSEKHAEASKIPAYLEVARKEEAEKLALRIEQYKHCYGSAPPKAELKEAN